MNDYREIANYMLGVCLAELVRLGVVSQDQVNGKWKSRCDLDARLEQLGFAAGASIDDNGFPIVVFNSKLTLQGLAHTLSHEAVHLAQICSGIYEPCSGYTIWEGVRYPNLSANDPNYFSPEYQSWEAQAHELEPTIREALLHQFPLLRDS